MVALLSSRWWRPIGLQAAPLTKAWGGLLDPGYFGPPAHTGRKPKCEKNAFLRLFVRPICPARADGGHLGLQDSSAGQISSALLKWKPQKCSFCAGQLRDHVQGQIVKCGMQSSSAQVVRVRRVRLDIAVRSRSLAALRKAIAAVVR